jgi:hypothetical protein
VIHAMLMFALNAIAHVPYEALVLAAQAELSEMVSMFIRTAHEDETPEDTMGYLHAAVSVYSSILTIASRGGIGADEDFEAVGSSSGGLHYHLFQEAVKLGSLDMGIAFVRSEMSKVSDEYGTNGERAAHTILSAYEVPEVRELFEKLTKVK